MYMNHKMITGFRGKISIYLQMGPSISAADCVTSFRESISMVKCIWDKYLPNPHL